MTSKISFSKLLKQDLKRSGGIIAIISLAFFLLLTVRGIFTLDQMLATMKNGGWTLKEVISQFAGLLSYNGIIIFLTVSSAVLCGVSRFCYLHSSTKLDFYHSLPIRRESFFWVQFLSGILQYVVPFIVNILIVLFIGALRGVTTGGVVGQVLLGGFIHILFYLLIYVTVILAMMLTGKIVVGILAVGVFFMYLPGVIFLTTGLFSIFFQTFYQNESFWMKLAEYFSPLFLYGLTVGAASDGSMFLRELLIGLVTFVAMLILVIYLYRIRSSEASERAVAFPKSESVIKFMLVVPISIGCGFIAHMMAIEGKDLWLAFGVIFGGIISSAIIEFIYHIDFTKVLARKKLMLASLIVSFAIIGIFRFDVFGYDSNIPKEENVESAAIWVDGLAMNVYEKWSDNGSYISGSDSKSYVMDHMNVTKLDSIYSIVESALNAPANAATNNVIVKYRLKDGKEKIRSYQAEHSVIEKGLEDLYQQPEFKEGLYPAINLTGDEIGKVELVKMDESIQLNLNNKQLISLVDTFREELSAMKYEDMKASSMVSMRLEGINRKVPSGSYSLYPCFEKTLALLKEYGYNVDAKMDPDNVISMRVVKYEEQGSQEEVFNSKEDFKEIADKLVSSSGSDYFLYPQSSSYDVNVTYKNEKGDTISSYMYLYNDNIPQCIKDRFGDK